ncbi:DUF4132 domain-containing protein [Spirillospora sp. NPDC050679]
MTSTDVLEIPVEWRAYLHPRRGGIPGPAIEPDPGAAAWLRDLTAAGLATVEGVAESAETEPGIGGRMRAWLRGEPDPVGAAATALVLVQGERPTAFGGGDLQVAAAERRRFADAWAAEHGLAFAACAFAELSGLHYGWESSRRPPERPNGNIVVLYAVAEGSARLYPGVVNVRSTHYLVWRDCWWGKGEDPLMLRLRALLAAASDAEYEEAAERLAAHRTSAFPRMAASYLIPTRRDWMDECCSLSARLFSQDVAQLQFLCSMSSPAHVAAYRERKRSLFPQDLTPAILGTLLEGAGAAAWPILKDCLSFYRDRDEQERAERGLLLQALPLLPVAEMFPMLLEQRAQKGVSAVLHAAAERHPVHAARGLAPIAAKGDTDSLAAAGMLEGWLRAYGDEPPAGIRELPADVRKVIDPYLRPRLPAADDLPELLVSPPWTRKGARPKPHNVPGLAAPAGHVAWEPGEREEWEGNVPFWAGAERVDWDEAAGKWAPEHVWHAERWLPPVIARFGTEALPVALAVVRAAPVQFGHLLLPFLDAEVARLMAGWLARHRKAGPIARRWFERHGTATVPLLLPDAFGKKTAERRAAEKALRLLAARHGAEDVVAAAAGHGGPVRAVLDQDPLDLVPARAPKITWADPARLPQILLRDRRRALPDAAAGHVLTMLAISRPDDEYAGLETVRASCDPASLAEFSWSVYRRWQAEGAPAKDNWAMAQLGLLGDDTTARRLTPLIRAWPGQGASARAANGLDVLAAIGTDVALTQLYGIARKLKFKGLKARAQAKIEEIAAARGLTPDQLADRAVPDFGLDADGSLVLDYGPRRFRLGFTEQLAPFVIGEDGKVRKTAPKPAATDDPELAPAAHALFAALRKDVKAVAEEEIRRLEQAMVNGREWSAAEFGELFVAHPLLWHLVRRLVWQAEKDGAATPFRLAEDRTFADADDDLLTVPDDARITLVHPLRLGESLKAWAELFADYEILQPFPQLGRPVHLLTGAERAATRLTRVEGMSSGYGRMKGLAKGRWIGDDSGRWIARRDRHGRHLVVELSPGLSAYDGYSGYEQTFRTVRAAADPAGPDGGLTLGDLDPVIVSEAIADLTRPPS